MASLLVHITCGPESPTKAALAFFVAAAAAEARHIVHVFLAGDAVQLVRAPVLNSLVGVGTGNLREHFDKVIGCLPDRWCPHYRSNSLHKPSAYLSLLPG
jgi:uncharacterized protein